MNSVALVTYKTNNIIFKIDKSGNIEKPYIVHLNDDVSITCDEATLGELFSLVLENLNV